MHADPVASCGDVLDGSFGAKGTGEKIVVLSSVCPGDSDGTVVYAIESLVGAWWLSEVLADHSGFVW